VSASSANSDALSVVVADLRAGREPEAAQVRDAVRALLSLLRHGAPGRSVEVRVPPYGAIQCVPGPAHKRGTPPNVVEMGPITFVLLATGELTWDDAVRDGRLTASGTRADLSPHLPVWVPPG
jgi:hypothetical protein